MAARQAARLVCHEALPGVTIKAFARQGFPDGHYHGRHLPATNGARAAAHAHHMAPDSAMVALLNCPT